ncbi:MAG: glycoside hydrolase family protein [Ferruginibacter sp.]|nr:glycoside hydrolase family protein [Ferruginibacter sp.]
MKRSKYRTIVKKLFSLVITLNLFAVNAQVKPGGIQLNQEGFYPNAGKLAVVTKKATGDAFYLLSANLKDTVYTGSLGSPLQSKNSSTITRIADFSSFKKAGKYVIAVPGVGNSFPFKINKNIHNAAGVAVLKGYYFQRVSMPLEQAYAGKWSRPAGHNDTAVLIHASAASAERPTGTVISTPGGWYDAGDYNKYIVNSGITMGTLLSAYEDFPQYFDRLNTNIPESKNDVPDLLDEVIYNLRWMLSMQDPYDGGVYNKCTNADFDGMVMPGITKAPRYAVQKGTAATLDFAAVTAQSSRVLQKFNSQFPGLADSCFAAATKAWEWAQVNPAMPYNQNMINQKYLPKINTGGYGDNKFDDEIFWAACELFATTKDQRYLATIQKGITAPVRIPSWANVHLLGLYTLFRTSQSLPTELLPLIDDARNRFIKFADELASGMEDNAFKTVMGKSKNDFNWGSNSSASNQGIVLVNAYQFTKNKKYIDAALTNLDYILGRNATGYCFVTGIGSRPTMHPHHRQSVADGIEQPVPGLLAGGPNPGKQDGCKYEFSEPETTYADEDCSYASNEIAINWNAPLVYLANAIEALQYLVGYSK